MVAIGQEQVTNSRSNVVPGSWDGAHATSLAHSTPARRSLRRLGNVD